MPQKISQPHSQTNFLHKEGKICLYSKNLWHDDFTNVIWDIKQSLKPQITCEETAWSGDMTIAHVLSTVWVLTCSLADSCRRRCSKSWKLGLWYNGFEVRIRRVGEWLDYVWGSHFMFEDKRWETHHSVLAWWSICWHYSSRGRYEGECQIIINNLHNHYPGV